MSKRNSNKAWAITVSGYYLYSEQNTAHSEVPSYVIIICMYNDVNVN